ncbi:hypothetical protein CTheo_5329 [Ceratobasidium theobromae]|uniref:Uncharacterized protein n=1 Tax=Ceratobasidium theobromae TaxID=1582974 RepID=A0A5N5QIX6_9AGAM|nr:hypothetical protein CTheo_5329 [Ceratobasidium theobromae]
MYQRSQPTQLPSPALSDMSTTTTTFPTLSESLSASASPYYITDWERSTYYHGISPDPPELLYRSDLRKNPFPIPQGRFPYLPIKTVHGVFGTRLNAVWDRVAPQICDLLKSGNIRYSALKTARFSIRDEGGNDKRGPIVIWIATHPSTTTPEDAHNITPAILSLLEDNRVEGAVVEWYEGTVEKLSGLPLLPVTANTNPTHYHRRFLTTALGMPITTREMETDDSQGSVAFFFHQNKDKHGNPSDKVFAVSNCHVLRRNTSIDYEFQGTGAPRQLVRLAGHRRFQRGMDEIKLSISHLGADADLLAREIEEMEEEMKSTPQSELEGSNKDLEAKQAQLAKVNKEIGTLEEFHMELNSQWSDIGRRNIGCVDWAPKISVDVDCNRFTLDIGTFELDKARFKLNYCGNTVDLGTKYSPGELTEKFYPRNNTRTTFKFPTRRLLTINGFVTHQLLLNPDGFDSNGDPCLIVMKDGNTTDLTVGRYSGMETYLSNELGVQSIELAIYNYDKESGPFSAKGDSGSLIFDGMGRMVGILHSGMRKGLSELSHVTYATPAWYVIEKLKTKYPHADFNQRTF